jgi:hypothetical protein
LNLVRRRMAKLGVVELVLLADVDEHATVDGLEKPRPMNLQPLEHDVAAGEDDRRAEPADVLESVERAGEQPVRKRVVDEIGRDQARADDTRGNAASAPK